MKFYKMCLGKEIDAHNGYVGYPLPEMLTIKTTTYHIYGVEMEGELKEIVTKIPLKPHDIVSESELGYYSKTEVDKSVIADFLRTLSNNGDINEYTTKISNILTEQIRKRNMVKEDKPLSDDDVISNFIRR